MSRLFKLKPCPIIEPHQIRARGLLQSGYRWPDTDRALLYRATCNKTINDTDRQHLAALEVRHA